MENTKLEPSRRGFLTAIGCTGLIALSGCTRSRLPSKLTTPSVLPTRDYDGQYGALLNEQFPIRALTPGTLPKKFQRQRVAYQTAEKPGTVVVDTRSFYLYHVERNGMAMRYGVGLGRAGFAWSGRARVAWKRKWPKWTPPAEMIERQPELAKWGVENGGMPPGLENPLGARALYIFQNGEDTLYRLHGTTEIGSIGRAVSSGCVRLVNHDVIDLYNRVRSGSPIIVLGS